MARQRRPDYDTERFRRLWYTATLAEMAGEYGVSITAIWLAGRKRGLPLKSTISFYGLEAND